MKKFNQMTEVQMSKTNGGFSVLSFIVPVVASVLGVVGFAK